MSPSPFDDLTDIYESMIDWPKRLPNETLFYRGLFEATGVRRVADVACGTGRHAALFHSWGLEVTAADISPNMIARARESFGDPQGLTWRVQPFDHPPAGKGELDAVVCLGNSLSLAPHRSAVTQSLGAMFSSVRSGGVVVVQVLNLWKLASGPSVWQKVVRRTIAGQEVTVIKGVHRCDDTGWVDLIIVPQDTAQPHHARSVPFLGLRPEELESAARSHAKEITFHGSIKSDPYDPAHSTDLIMVARR